MNQGSQLSAGLRNLLQPGCEEMKREWGNEEEMERKWGNGEEMEREWGNGEKMRKLRGNGERVRKWRENEEMERERGNGERFTLYIFACFLYFLPLYPFPIIKNCRECHKQLNICFVKIIPGWIGCKEASQVVPAWYGLWRLDKLFWISFFKNIFSKTKSQRQVWF